MHGIELKSGANDCYWNIRGRCTNYNVTRNKRDKYYSRDWNSKQNCTLTQVGVWICGGYIRETEGWGFMSREKPKVCDPMLCKSCALVNDYPACMGNDAGSEAWEEPVVKCENYVPAAKGATNAN